MKKTASKMAVKCLHCAAHMINLVLSSAMEYDYVAGILKKCRDMVTKLNKSNVIRLSYQSYLKEFDLPSITPGTDCSTRWGSTFQARCLRSTVRNLSARVDR